MSDFRTLDQLDPKGQRVLLRVDLNVPMENGVVSDATRIARVAPGVPSGDTSGCCGTCACSSSH